ncbi:glycoside hydrolase family 5 protein [Macrolepiota fuliginosa MF-IS2]|uniref:mannan endo-1,4-beta-mannosidase n=1 Tax=Macrolepiota fuliginosa MF-IS2 TaxID=1400762 RepID=A0A9P5XKR0_9AGAR|nr:glycoside hydrolase family 5 protein [Macrolepiota fuliginosa MF-IS2]
MRLPLVYLLVTLATFTFAKKASNVPKGFATTQGRNFEVDGKPFAFVGANSYWLPLLTSKEDVEATFKEMQAGNVKVVRTWGFNAINGSELAGALQSGLTYYQVWNSTEWVLNDGPQGLQRLDYVVETAGKYGIKLIVAFTNNWVGYGGMELYINWIAGAGKTHDVFYTDSRIVSSYQRYVQTIVDRYKHSPNIFAWELVNEARCLGDLPAGPNCVPGSNTLHTWYQEQSEFVRNLDRHHMITTGGEGQFYWKTPVGYWWNNTWISDYNYNGQAGEDFDFDLQLENIDFGAYHMYPQSWYPLLDFPGSNWTTKSWGLEWIQQHADAAKKANKPVILEEFGLSGYDNKTDVYPEWVDLALETEHGVMPWQFGVNGLKESGGNRLIKYADALIDGASPDDGLAIYRNQTFLWNVFTNAAKVQASRFS